MTGTVASGRLGRSQPKGTRIMKKFAALALATTAALALAACGSSEGAKEEAQADNVEMPAEEAVQDVDATPAPDASGAAGAEAAAGEAPKP